MPTGPNGEKRPADVIGNAVVIAKIATGEIEDEVEENNEKDPAAQELGKKGGKARAESLTPQQRTKIAQKAAKKRWKKS